MRSRTIALVGIALVWVLGGGCGDPKLVPTPTPTPRPQPTATPEPTASPEAAAAHELWKLTAPDSPAWAGFGRALSISEDTMAVGAPFELNEDGSDVNWPGSLYVFYRDPGDPDRWVDVAKVAVGGDGRLGEDVSVSGDVVVAGAPFDLDSTGAAYVFQRDAGGTDNWGLVARLVAPDGGRYEYFGGSVSVSGDTAMVGAGSYGGDAVYVFRRDSGGVDNWGQVAKLVASDGGERDHFGEDIALSDDVALISAAWQEVQGVGGAGSVYVFHRQAPGTDAWEQVAKLTDPHPTRGGSFGDSLSLSGDALLVGAELSRPAVGDNLGVAHVFNRNEGGSDNWGHVAKLAPLDREPYEWFGRSAAISGHVAVVGAALHADESGAAWVFHDNQGNWAPVAKLVVSDDAAPVWLGYACAVDEDRVLVGASGAVYGFGFFPPRPVALLPDGRGAMAADQNRKRE